MRMAKGYADSSLPYRSQEQLSGPCSLRTPGPKALQGQQRPRRATEIGAQPCDAGISWI